MTLSEIIEQNPAIFGVLQANSNIDANQNVITTETAVDDWWFETVIGQQPTHDGDTSSFVVRLELYEEDSGDIKANTQLVHNISEEGDIERSFILMRNWEDMRADLRTEVDKWGLKSVDVELAKPLLIAAEMIRLSLSDDIQCQSWT